MALEGRSANLLGRHLGLRIGPVDPEGMSVVAVEGVDKVSIADPVRSLESSGLGLKQTSAFEAVQLQIHHDLNLRPGPDSLVVRTPREWAHHHEPAALVDVQQAVGEQAGEALPVRRVVAELGHQVKVPVDVAIGGRIRSGRQLAVPGSDPLEPKAKTFVWRNQDLKTILAAKLDDGRRLPEEDGRGVATLGVGPAAENEGHLP